MLPPMPYNLRFVVLLLVATFATAPIAVYVAHRQFVAQTRIMAEQLTRGNVDRGRLAVSHYGCGACHSIEGLPGASGVVGPSLDGIAERAEIAGKLANDPANMVRWIRAPQQISPGNGMPDLGVSAHDGRDIAAYLYTLRKFAPS
jgi:cytochrome c2